MSFPKVFFLLCNSRTLLEIVASASAGTNGQAEQDERLMGHLNNCASIEDMFAHNFSSSSLSSTLFRRKSLCIFSIRACLHLSLREG